MSEQVIDREQEIVEKYIQAAAAEIEKERAKSRETKEGEQLAGQLLEEIQDLSARLVNLTKTPSLNKAKINKAEARHNEIYKRLQELGVFETSRPSQLY